MCLHINYFCFSYNVIFFLATYLLPMVGMGACYLEMGRNLWGGEVIGTVNL
jgi:hypothetical protein